MLKLKLQYFGHLMQRVNSSGKDPDAGTGWGQEERGMTEDEMVGWHHQLSGHEFEQTLGDGEGQGNLACCSACGCKVSAQLRDWITEQQFFILLQLFFYYFFLFFLPFPHLSSLFPFFVRGLLFLISALLPMSRIPGDLFFYLWMKFIITAKFTHVPPWIPAMPLTMTDKCLSSGFTSCQQLKCISRSTSNLTSPKGNLLTCIVKLPFLAFPPWLMLDQGT